MVEGVGNTIHIDGKTIEIVDDAMAEVLRAKTGAERLAIAWGLWKSARDMMTAYLTDTHPDWTAEQVQAEVAKRMSHGEVSVGDPAPDQDSSSRAREIWDED